MHNEGLKHVTLLVENEFVHAKPADRMVPVDAPFCVFLYFWFQTIAKKVTKCEIRKRIKADEGSLINLSHQILINKTYICLLMPSKSYMTGGSVSNFMCL